MSTFIIHGPFIPLIQLLKALQWVENGGEAQSVVSEGMVKYNGQVDYRKRLKLKAGDVVEYDGKKVTLQAVDPTQPS